MIDADQTRYRIISVHVFRHVNNRHENEHPMVKMLRSYFYLYDKK